MKRYCIAVCLIEETDIRGWADAPEPANCRVIEARQVSTASPSQLEQNAGNLIHRVVQKAYQIFHNDHRAHQLHGVTLGAKHIPTERIATIVYSPDGEQRVERPGVGTAREGLTFPDHPVIPRTDAHFDGDEK